MDEIVRRRKQQMTPEEKTTLKLGIGRIPEILLDTTDRNRTSPFAFTGNRFEFRAAGSSSNCAAAMIAINAAMANQLNEFRASVEKLMEEGVGKDEAIFRLLKETIIASEPIRFEGDGYSEEWKQEAARRGLSNICHVPEALMHYMDNQSKSVLIGERIFNETELACRLEVELEKYTMKVQIESRVLGDLAINHIVPIAVIYQNRLLENLRGLKEIFPPEEYEIMSADRKELIREISRRVTAIKVLVRDMTEARKVANHKDNFQKRHLPMRKPYGLIWIISAIISIIWKWKSMMKYGLCPNTGSCYSLNNSRIAGLIAPFIKVYTSIHEKYTLL